MGPTSEEQGGRPGPPPESSGFWTPARRRRVRAYLVALGIAIVAWRWYRTYLVPEGDFTLHWIFARRLRLGGYLYAAGMHTPYPPFWGLALLPISLGPMAAVRLALYPFGLVPGALLLAGLARRLHRTWPLDREPTFWALAMAVVLASRFLIRELPECGANLAITALAWGGVFAWTRRRDTLGGLSLGLAAALKCTPALFLLYFAWKRQWRLALVGAGTAAALSLAPAAAMGPRSYALHMRHWLETVRAGASQAHPLRGVLGDEETHNLGLRPALGRLLVSVPPTHKGYLAHPWRIQPLDLDPATAGRLVKGLTAALLVASAARIGRKPPRRDGVRVLWEAAAVGLLMLLLSPITWRQHCVGAVPALTLIAWRRVACGPDPSRWVRAAVGFYVLGVLVLDRGLIGPDLTRLLDSYGLTAWTLLALLAVCLDGAIRSPDRPGPSAAAPGHQAAPRPHCRPTTIGRAPTTA